MQCWELPPTNISVQPRLPRAAQKNTWVWCGNGTHGASFHGKQREAHSGPKGSHDVNSITCTTEFMSPLPFPSLLTCKKNFLDEKQVQQVHQELQGCALRAAFSPAASDNFPTHTSVLSEIFSTFLQCPQSSSSILPSSQDHPKGTSRKTSAPSSSSPDFPRMFVKLLCVIQTLHVTLPTQTGKQGYPPSPTDCCSHWKSLCCK